MKIAKLILYILFGLMFINAGLNKFLNYLPLPELSPEQLKFFTAFTSIVWLMPLVAIIEIIGGILFILKKNTSPGCNFCPSCNDRYFSAPRYNGPKQTYSISGPNGY